MPAQHCSHHELLAQQAHQFTERDTVATVNRAVRVVWLVVIAAIALAVLHGL